MEMNTVSIKVEPIFGNVFSLPTTHTPISDHLSPVYTDLSDHSRHQNAIITSIDPNNPTKPEDRMHHNENEHFPLEQKTNPCLQKTHMNTTFNNNIIPESLSADSSNQTSICIATNPLNTSNLLNDLCITQDPDCLKFISQVKPTEALFVNTLVGTCKRIAPLWFRSVSTMRERNREENRRMATNNGQTQNDWSQIRNKICEMTPIDETDAVANLLKKLYKELPTDSILWFLKCWLGNPDTLEDPHSCVISRGDAKGRMRRIDGGKGSDKVWRLDTIVGMLYHGLPMSSTDTNIMVHTCDHELCVRPQHLRFRASSVALVVVLKALAQAGYTITPPSNSLQSNGPQSTMGSSGLDESVDVFGPFTIEELQRYRSENLCPADDSIPKLSLTGSDKHLIDSLDVIRSALYRRRSSHDSSSASSSVNGGPPPSKIKRTSGPHSSSSSSLSDSSIVITTTPTTTVPGQLVETITNGYHQPASYPMPQSSPLNGVQKQQLLLLDPNACYLPQGQFQHHHGPSTPLTTHTPKPRKSVKRPAPSSNSPPPHLHQAVIHAPPSSPPILVADCLVQNQLHRPPPSSSVLSLPAAPVVVETNQHQYTPGHQPPAQQQDSTFANFAKLSSELGHQQLQQRANSNNQGLFDQSSFYHHHQQVVLNPSAFTPSAHHYVQPSRQQQNCLVNLSVSSQQPQQPFLHHQLPFGGGQSSSGKSTPRQPAKKRLEARTPTIDDDDVGGPSSGSMLVVEEDGSHPQQQYLNSISSITSSSSEMSPTGTNVVTAVTTTASASFMVHHNTPFVPFSARRPNSNGSASSLPSTVTSSSSSILSINDPSSIVTSTSGLPSYPTNNGPRSVQPVLNYDTGAIDQRRRVSADQTFLYHGKVGGGRLSNDSGGEQSLMEEGASTNHHHNDDSDDLDEQELIDIMDNGVGSVVNSNASGTNNLGGESIQLQSNSHQMTVSSSSTVNNLPLLPEAGGDGHQRLQQHSPNRMRSMIAAIAADLANHQGSPLLVAPVQPGDSCNPISAKRSASACSLPRVGPSPNCSDLLDLISSASHCPGGHNGSFPSNPVTSSPFFFFNPHNNLTRLTPSDSSPLFNFGRLTNHPVPPKLSPPPLSPSSLNCRGVETPPPPLLPPQSNSYSSFVGNHFAGGDSMQSIRNSPCSGIHQELLEMLATMSQNYGISNSRSGSRASRPSSQVADHFYRSFMTGSFRVSPYPSSTATQAPNSPITTKASPRPQDDGMLPLDLGLRSATPPS